MSTKKFTLFSLIIISLSLICNCQEDKMLKQSKAYTCMLLARAKMEAKGASAQVDREGFTNGLINCYINIGQDDIAQVISTIQTGAQIDISNKRMKELVDGDKLIGKYKPEEIQKIALEVDGVMKELQREQMRMQQGGYDEDGSIPSGGDNPGFLMRILAGLIKVLAIDGYLGVGIMIIAAFFLLRTLRAICGGKKKKHIEEEKENEKSE